jgi:kumamolisin
MVLEAKLAMNAQALSAITFARAVFMGIVLSSTSLIVVTPARAADTSGITADTNLRTADDSQSVQFALTLPLRNQEQLKRELKEIYNRSSTHYRHFLSASDFISKYGPTQSDYASLEAFAAKSGLKVTGEHPGRTMVNVLGSTATIRNLFKSQMYWRQTSEGKEYLASDVEPTLPSELSNLGGSVVGLNQKPLKAFAEPAQSSAGNSPNAGSGPNGLYEPADIKTAYNLNSIQNGGQPVALAELSSANYSDAAVYASQFGLNNPSLTQVAVDGGTTETSGASEVMLDIEMVMAVSNAKSIYVYTAPNTIANALDVYAKIADDDLVGQASTSWGLCEADVGQSLASQENTVFSQMAAEGIAMFAASGDLYAYDCQTSSLAVNDPASQPYVTGVGGTTLTTTTSQGYSSETVWYHTAPTGEGYNGYEGSGGGVSIFWPIPDYQTTVTPQSSQFSSTLRNVPDVALDADPNTGYYIYCSICASGGTAGWGGWAGTSAAAPQWAALWSLIGAGLTTPSGRAGFANPSLYAIAENASEYAQTFHDVTTGGNGYFNAVTGYDNATGWGSYNGAGLYQAVIAQQKARASIAPIIHYVVSQIGN